MEGYLSKNGIYPNLISVNVGMKIIENHVVDSDTITKYRYNFDGYNTDGKEYIETTVKEENI